MFFGTIDENSRRYLAANRDVWKDRVVVVGCSGNFTLEKIILQEAEPREVHSNDVTLYSRLLGDAMLGRPTPLSITEDAYRWMEPWVEHPSLWHRLAAAMILLRMLKFEKRNSAYARRMWARYETAFTPLVEASAARLEKAAVPITSFTSGDVFEHFQSFQEKIDRGVYSPEEVLFTAYLPYYKGDYESQYRRLETIWGFLEFNPGKPYGSVNVGGRSFPASSL